MVGHGQPDQPISRTMTLLPTDAEVVVVTEVITLGLLGP
jgi:hypothetical protein